MYVCNIHGQVQGIRFCLIGIWGTEVMNYHLEEVLRPVRAQTKFFLMKMKAERVVLRPNFGARFVLIPTCYIPYSR